MNLNPESIRGAVSSIIRPHRDRPDAVAMSVSPQIELETQPNPALPVNANLFVSNSPDLTTNYLSPVRESKLAPHHERNREWFLENIDEDVREKLKTILYGIDRRFTEKTHTGVAVFAEGQATVQPQSDESGSAGSKPDLINIRIANRISVMDQKIDYPAVLQEIFRLYKVSYTTDEANDDSEGSQRVTSYNVPVGDNKNIHIEMGKPVRWLEDVYGNEQRTDIPIILHNGIREVPFVNQFN